MPKTSGADSYNLGQVRTKLGVGKKGRKPSLPVVEPLVEEVIEDIADNSVMMEDINQNENESDESKRDTSAEYEDDAVKRFQRKTNQNWIPLTNLASEDDITWETDQLLI